MNRYTNISLSEFNPMTLQEKMIVPSIKRKQHDSISADQTAILDKLNKVQPHDKYFNEAQMLKKQITDKISEHATKLATQGVSNNMLSDTIALNREYNDLASETGKLGMINAHNLNVAKVKDDYLKQAEKMNQSPEAAKYWIDEAMKKHMKSPLYDERGRVIDFKIDQDVVKYVDREAKFHEFAKSVDSLTGKSWDDIRSGFGERADGTVYVKESGSKGYNKNNYASLQKVADYMNSQLKDKSSDLYKSEMYNRRDLNNAMLSNLRQAEMYMKEDTESGTSNKISNVQYPSKDSQTNVDPTQIPFGIPDNSPKGVVKIGGESTNTSEIEDIGIDWKFKDPKAGSLVSFGVNLVNAITPDKKSYKDIKDPIVKNMYEATFNAMNSDKGLTFKNKEGKVVTWKFKKKLGEKDKDDNVNAKQVSDVIKMMPEFTYQKRIINNGMTLNNFGLMPNQDTKNKSQVNAQLADDLRQNKRQFIDEDGKLISWNKLPNLSKVKSISYGGYQSPIGLQNTEDKTTSQKMPHYATIQYNDNTTLTMPVTRIKGLDDRGINEVRMDELNENASTAIAMSQIDRNKFHPIKSKSKAFEGTSIRYIPPMFDGDQGYYEIKTPNGTSLPKTEDEMIAIFNKTR